MKAPKSATYFWAAMLLAFTSISTGIHAEDVLPRTIRAGVFVNAPFVMESRGKPAGMAIDLWNAVSTELGVKSEFRTYPTVGELLAAAAKGEVDVAVANLTITQKRAEQVDFTFPWFDSGQRIMIDPHRGTKFWDVLGGLKNSGFLRTYFWLALAAFGATVWLTIFDRRYNPDFPKRWLDGFGESFYSVMAVVSGRPTGRKGTTGWIGRVWQGLWLVFGVATVAYVTSSVTSVMTTLSLKNQISSVSDLSGHLVGVSSGSVSEDFARDRGLDFKLFPHVDESVDALRSGDVAAVVGDAEVLEYYDHAHPEQGLEVVGAVFEPDKYAFALPHQSVMTRPVALTLLGLQERGVVEELRKKYFGENP